jgi:S1-C subfamily serine protease
MAESNSDTTTGALTSFSDELANAVETAAVSVVRVEARRGNASSGIIWSKDGHIITADHALEKEEDIAIGLGDGRTTTAKLLARDPGTDLALLKIDTMRCWWSP